MNSFISWVGGKRLLREEIIKRFPKKFNRYIEAFGGGAWVLFARDKHANTEIYNDANSELVNLFRCVKNHHRELENQLSFILNSREVFNRLVNMHNLECLTDIQRAARFFYLIKMSYGSNCKDYCCIKKNVNTMVEYLTKVQNRLANVIIEHKDFQNLIQVYDREDALTYLDPPYYGAEKYYQNKFSEVDHKRLYSCLKNIKGKFILSYNDCEFTRKLYKDFNIEGVQRQDSLRARYKTGNRYKELIIKNY